MDFTKSELEMLYQYAAPTKEETLAGLKEIVPILERKDDLLTTPCALRWKRHPLCGCHFRQSLIHSIPEGGENPWQSSIAPSRSSSAAMGKSKT